MFKKIRYIIYGLLLFGAGVGCGTVINQPEATPTATQEPLSTPTEIAVVTEEPVAVVTEVPTVEFVPSTNGPILDPQSVMYYPEWCASQIHRAGDECVDENTDLERAIAITIYNEAGALTPVLAANMLKMIDNYAYSAYTNEWAEIIQYNGLGWYSLPRQIRMNLVAHLLSRPYTRTIVLREYCSDEFGCQQWTEDRQYPGWNGWGVPFAAGVLENCEIGVTCSYPHGTRQWIGIQAMVKRWLDDPTQIYFQAVSTDGTIADNARKYMPSIELNDRRLIYSYSSTNLPISELEDRARFRLVYQANEHTTYYVYFMDFPYAE